MEQTALQMEDEVHRRAVDGTGEESHWASPLKPQLVLISVTAQSDTLQAGVSVMALEGVGGGGFLCEILHTVRPYNHKV